jgi:hypothetical protein
MMHNGIEQDDSSTGGREEAKDTTQVWQNLKLQSQIALFHVSPYLLWPLFSSLSLFLSLSFPLSVSRREGYLRKKPSTPLPRSNRDKGQFEQEKTAAALRRLSSALFCSVLFCSVLFSLKSVTCVSFRFIHRNLEVFFPHHFFYQSEIFRRWALEEE